jgi:hypothetical protein
MKLRDYIIAQGLSITEAARQLDIRYAAVHLWFHECRIPTEDNMRAIYVWSGGTVQPNDFYDLPPLEDQPPAAGHRCNGALAQSNEVAA